MIHNLARAVIISGTRILLSRYVADDRDDFYFLPGGHIEYGETIYKTLQRELKEEIGLQPHDIEKIEIIGIYEHSWDDKAAPYHEINFVCRCDIDGKDTALSVQSLENHLKVEWHDIHRLKSINFLPCDFSTLIPKWLENPVEPERFFRSNFGQ